MLQQVSIFTANRQGALSRMTSILAKENKMPMLVFGLKGENSIVNTVKGKFNGTRVTV